MDESETLIFEFGSFRLNAGKRLLTNGADVTVPLMPKAFDTLLYLVRNSGRVIEKDEMMLNVWADTIVEENNLTQNISILRRVLGEKPGEHRFIVTVPGQGYKFVADVRLTPGLPPLTDGPATAEIPYQTPKDESNPADEEGRAVKNVELSRIFLIAAFIGLIIGLSLIGVYLTSVGSNSNSNPLKTVAVLPFKPLLPENRNDALEIGMADSLISKLSGGEEITVRPLSAVRRYNSLEQNPLAAGRELSVEAVLDGTIHISADRIRVSAKLLRVNDGRQLWAQQFDEKSADIFAVQDSISERVAAALKIRFGNGKRNHFTKNIEAYQLYMKGRYHALNLTQAETDKGVAYYRQAIELDPEYVLPYVGLAEVYLTMVLTSGVPSAEVLPQAKAAALRAVEIDETSGDAHAALGALAFWYDWDWQEAERQYLRALQLRPNSAEAHFYYAHLLSNTGRHERALAEIKLSREIDPLFLRTGAIEGQILFFAGQADDALDRLNMTIDLNPNFWLSHLFISAVYIEKGMYDAAADSANRASDISGNTLSKAYLAYALARSGKSQEARDMLDELLELSKVRYVPPYDLAIIYNGLDESDKALDYLEKAFAEKNVLIVFLKVEPKWNNLRREPRYISLMKRMNFE